ncbi:MAG: CMGC protein kinase [Amphiamblys sp. WSBS2006]|nr:MAG: CMGC protein kinase [Amphiamblys sp. WSBS2006]
MAGKYLKHLLLFFLSASAIVGAVDESVVDTDKASEYYKEKDYEKLDNIGFGKFGTVSKVREKKTGKIYALKTFGSGPEGYEHAEREINTLEQLDHKNVIKMIANSLGARSKEDPVHIVLEYMPCDLKYAALNHPEIKENTREILHHILEGVAHIHSKKLAHNDLSLKNILIDPANMSVKICDFGNCHEGGKEEYLLGVFIDGYYKDVSSVVDLMVHLYLGKSMLERVCLRRISIGKMERFLKTKRVGGVLPQSGLGMIYREMEGVVTENGLDLFLKALATKNRGGYTAAASAQEHPFFDGIRELGPPTKEPKQRRLLN